MRAARPTAGPTESIFQFLARPADSPLTGCGLLGVVDPTDELIARQRCDVPPGGQCPRMGGERRPQIVRQIVHHTAGDVPDSGQRSNSSRTHLDNSRECSPTVSAQVRPAPSLASSLTSLINRTDTSAARAAQATA